MKPPAPFFIAFTLLNLSASAQHDCLDGRYQTALFQQVQIQSDVLYGQASNSDNFPVDLRCDVYTPVGDTATQRALVILAHGGSFYAGNKTADTSIVYFCTELAKHGYVTVSMNYRLENPLNIFVSSDIEKTFLEAVFRAVQDQKALIRFFRKSVAEQNNPYGIDPNRILVGGNSAGAILSLHTAYLDETSKIPSKIDAVALGGLEGNSGNPGYDSKPQAVVNLCGALGDSLWLEAGDQALVSVHGDQDDVVPHNTGIANPGIAIMTVHGSASLALRASNQGVHHGFYLLKGAGHSPQNSDQAYMDTAFTFVRDFLADLICQKGLSAQPGSHPAEPKPPYPNPLPSGELLQLDALWKGHMSLFDGQGRLVFQRELSSGNQETPFSLNLPAGPYVLLHTNPQGKSFSTILLVE